MSQLIEFKTQSGEKVFIEIVVPADMQPLAADGSDIIKKASQTFESALAGVQHAATVLVESVSKIGMPADTIEMELGVKASAKAGFYLASADSEAQIKIKLVWNKKREGSPVSPSKTL
jgi:Na+-transporting NADH:ubiquinone oxidoreductase subunit NqrA